MHLLIPARYSNPYLREDPTHAMPHLMQHSAYKTRPVSFHTPSANRQLYQVKYPLISCLK